ncbi:MAG: DNA repair protein RadC [Chloroflexota bacterium]
MMRDIAASERPRERLKHHGASALSNAELIAILLRVGVKGENAVRLSERLLVQFHGLSGLLRASVAELSAIKGVGDAKATQIKAALELGRRLMIESPDERPIVKSPADAANLIMLEMSAHEQEHMRVVLLDTRNRVLGTPTIYIGNLNTAVVRIAELFREAIRHNCAAIIVAHNHPSGDPSPSPEDVRITEQIVSAGKLLDIDVLDHLIIGGQRFVSLKERGLGFS